MSIAENVKEVREKIEIAAKKSGRESNKVALIGVTKTVQTPQIKELLASNVKVLGENRVQEFLPKYEVLSREMSAPPEWHFIGHLQRNKVKYIIDKVDLIHSVDSIELAQEINKQAQRFGKIMQFLAEVNIAKEPSKFGICPDQILEVAKKLVNMRHVRLAGLMCVAPFVENGEENRQNFKKMRNLLLDIQRKGLYDTEIQELSMGMTGDYEVAIEEGATMVRLGTALVGSRQ